MAVAKKPSALKSDNLRKVKLEAQTLRNIKPKVLSDREIATALGAKMTAVITAVTLSPNKPRTGKNFLSFYSAMMVLAEPAPSNNIALFSSAYPALSSPGIKVEFDAIKPNRKHLVEFNLTLAEPSTIYKFRVFNYPFASFQDISISGSQVISVLIQPESGISSYGAAIHQLNTKAEACGWIFHSLKISSVD